MRTILFCIFQLLTLFCHAQLSNWPATEEEMRAEPSPYERLPEIIPSHGTAILMVHMVNGYQMPDSLSLRYFMGTDSIMTSTADSTGTFHYHVPLARTCGAFLDNRCYIFLSPGDTTEIWLSQQSPLVKKERKIFVRGPFASLISDINNQHSQPDILREHLFLPSSDMMDYMMMEKSVTDMLKTVSHFGKDLPPLVMDEVILVCKNPKTLYSRFFPDILNVIRQHNILTTKTISRELKFASIAAILRRAEPHDKSLLTSLPQPYQDYLLDTKK